MSLIQEFGECPCPTSVKLTDVELNEIIALLQNCVISVSFCSYFVKLSFCMCEVQIFEVFFWGWGLILFETVKTFSENLVQFDISISIRSPEFRASGPLSDFNSRHVSREESENEV